MRRALLLCTSHNDLGLVRALRKLGYYIIATGDRPGAPGERWVDEYIKADYSDKDLILEIAYRKEIDAICPCCNDFGVYTAAYVAEKMGLGCFDTYETTLLLHNKDRFKKFSEKYDILTPRAHTYNNPENALKDIKNMPYPIMIKPTDASAGNGVSKAIDHQEAVLAVDKAFKRSKSKRIVVEPFIEGPQYGFCTFLVDQKVVAYVSNNEYSLLNPYRVEIDTFPADDRKSTSSILIEQIEKIAELLQLKDGIFHLQYIERDGKPWIIEVMRRILGNMYSVPANMLTGIDWDYWEVRARCGLGCRDFPAVVKQEGFYAYKAIMSTQNGTIKNISIPKEYEKYIVSDFWVKKKGDIIQDHTKEPIGFLFMMFSDQTQMRKVLIDGYRCDLVELEGDNKNKEDSAIVFGLSD